MWGGDPFLLKSPHHDSEPSFYIIKQHLGKTSVNATWWPQETYILYLSVSACWSRAFPVGSSQCRKLLQYQGATIYCPLSPKPCCSQLGWTGATAVVIGGKVKSPDCTTQFLTSVRRSEQNKPWVLGVFFFFFFLYLCYLQESQEISIFLPGAH